MRRLAVAVVVLAAAVVIVAGLNLGRLELVWEDLVIVYGAHGHREQIERLIGGDSFFGVPYSLRNV